MVQAIGWRGSVPASEASKVIIAAMAIQRAASLLLLLAALALAPGAGAATTTQLPRGVRPTHYALAITPDAAALTFAGRAEIAIEVTVPTRAITLNALDLVFSDVKLSGAGAELAPPEVTVDPAAQTATFTFARDIPRGRYRLAIGYAGRIGTQAVGLFALDYETPDGRRRALFTQFEAADARRMAPSWDEPSYKATFSVEAVVPAGEMAVSNMPVETRTDLGDGRARVVFARTPEMSTYLLFLAVGDLERATAQAGNVEVGVVTRRGAVEKAAFALESSAAVVRDYDEYFGTPYPLPKLDNVAAPGRSQFFGAMENWGAILSFEYILLLDPAISTAADRQTVYAVAAHEIAHQWFGNLVTMAWWDDLWLNEGFASWMAGRTMEKFHPEWNTVLGAVADRDEAMTADALRTTHPVVQPVATVEQMSQAFDAITYQKGEAVIRMLEGYVGPDAWRDGVRRYMRRHAYGNTVSADLWRAIEEAARKPITAIARDFTEKPGVPLITVSDPACRGGEARVVVTQGEMSRDRPGKKPLGWRVPVIAQTAGGAPVRAIVSGGKATLTAPGCGPVVVNAGQSGYYRTLYAPAAFARLVETYPGLPAVDQFGILVDAWALGRAGLQPASDVLDLAEALPAGADPQLWGRVAKIFGDIHGYARGDGEGAFREFARARLAPVLAAVGWEARAGEPTPAAILRNDLLEALGKLGDPAVLAEARRRFARQAEDPSAIPGPLRKTILGIVARHADTETWDRLLASARAEKTPLVRDQLYYLLASAADEGLARRALALALTPEPGATNSAEMVSRAANEHPDLAFDFAMEHMAALDQRLDATSRTRYYAGIAGRSADPAMLGKLRAYADAHVDARSRRAVETAAADIEDRIRVRARVLPAVEAWLAAQGTRRAAGDRSNEATGGAAE
jgi:aminopeptidase N